MATRRKRRRSNNPYGRPSQGLTDAAVLVRCPTQLAADMRARAAELGVTVSQAWRLAAMALLGQGVTVGPVPPHLIE